MIRREFENIAKGLNAEYKYEEEVVVGIGSSSMPISYHTLTVPYRDSIIIINYEFGNHNMASVKMKTISSSHQYKFAIKKTNAFRLLLRKDKKSLQVRTKSILAKSKIENLLELTGLEEMALNSQFEPNVKFKSANGLNIVETTFYLGFKGKEKSIRRMLNFHKGLLKLIDLG